MILFFNDKIILTYSLKPYTNLIIITINLINNWHEYSYLFKYKNDIKYGSDSFSKLRTGRAGLSLVVIGVYLMFFFSEVIIPKPK